MNRGLHDLEALAAMVFEAELAKLNEVSRELAERRAALGKLTATRADRERSLSRGRPEDDLAFLTGRDAPWSDWLVQAGARLSREAAEIAARREDQRQRTKRAFGKHDALAQILEREMSARRARSGRGTDQTE